MHRVLFGEARNRQRYVVSAARIDLAKEQWPSRTRLLFLVSASLFLWLVVLRLGLALS